MAVIIQQPAVNSDGGDQFRVKIVVNLYSVCLAFSGWISDWVMLEF